MARRIMRSLVAWTLLAGVNAILGDGAAAQGRGAVASPTAAPALSADAEKGRTVVAEVCATCHTTIARMLQVHKQTAEQWKETVYFMISRGAQIMPDEVEPVTAFLAATAGTGSRPAARGAAAQPVPQRDGSVVLQRNCQQCHDLATATKTPAAGQWDAVITRMMSYGARLSAEDKLALTAYLIGLGK